ncbi:MAG: hypothetical protein RLZ55_301 [Actinomycetota bacterium]
MSTATTIALLVVVPLVAILIVVGIVLGPQWGRAGRWRPGESWSDEDEWFGPDAQRTEVDQQSGQLAVGSGAALVAAELGGARGRW